ncbi:MAG: hypothetical protein IJ191_01410 [Treponema sp.]|nr:hypothetical protein [Treponema sp.]
MKPRKAGFPHPFRPQNIRSNSPTSATAGLAAVALPSHHPEQLFRVLAQNTGSRLNSQAEYVIFYSMELFAEQLMNRYLRTCLSLFSVKEFTRTVRQLGIAADYDECETFLDMNANVFALTNGRYITRAGVFTGRYFSIKPTALELAEQVLFPGHRCMPFVDPDELSSSLRFFLNGQELPRKVVELNSSAAESYYFLYGDEFSPQYIVADPANNGVSLIDNEFLLPPKVKLTGVSLKSLITRYGFKVGDRLLCRVADWNAGIIDVEPIIRPAGRQLKRTDVRRNDWYGALERALEISFDRAGPCASIEEQLALVFLENAAALCVPDCGSVEELLMDSQKISAEQYGIETRLWRRGESVPAIGSWNTFSDMPDDTTVSANFFVTDFLIDASIKDHLAEKKYTADGVIACIIPNGYVLSQQEREALCTRIATHAAAVRSRYNHFADFPLTAVRHDALELYSQVNSLVFQIDKTNMALEKYPQQELVTISQIYSHVARIIEMIEIHPDEAIQECDELALSLDGMHYNYECIHEQLDAVIKDSFHCRLRVST